MSRDEQGMTRSSKVLFEDLFSDQVGRTRPDLLSTAEWGVQATSIKQDWFDLELLNLVNSFPYPSKDYLIDPDPDPPESFESDDDFTPVEFLIGSV